MCLCVQSDERAGTQVDGIILSSGIAQWDWRLMDRGLNRYMTFAVSIIIIIIITHRHTHARTQLLE